MSAGAIYAYRDGYRAGQHDALTWLSVPPDPSDEVLVAIDTPVQMRASLICLASNLAIGAALCRAFRLGVLYGAERVTCAWNGGGWTYPFEPGHAMERQP